MWTDDGFESRFEELGPVELPPYSGVRVQMMPVILGQPETIPPVIGMYRRTIEALADSRPQHCGQVGYVTIDEKHVAAGATHRRAGLHVDGMHNGRSGGWGGGGGGWGSVGNGMATVSSPAGCRAWRGRFVGKPGPDGECEHLAEQCGEAVLFRPGVAYWVDGLCVHESVPMVSDTPRQFVRLSFPSDAAWFEGYTANPLGVKPSGPILPRRKYMEVV